MPSNSFVPDTVPVKGHSRRMPAKRDSMRQSSFSPTENAMGASPPDQPSEPAMGQSFGQSQPVQDFAPVQTQPPLTPAQAAIQKRLAIRRTAANLAGMAGAAVMPETGLPWWGESLRRIITAGSIAGMIDPKEALPNAGMQTIGEGVGGLIHGAGSIGMQLAGKLGPDLAEVANRERILQTPGGLRRLQGLIRQVTGQLNGEIATAAQVHPGLNPTTTANDIENLVRRDLATSSTAPNDPAVQNRLAALRQQFLAGKGPAIDLNTGQVFKKSAGTVASSQFSRQDVGGRLAEASDPIEKLWKLHENQVLAQRLEAAVPTYAERNQRLQGLIRLKNELAPEIDRNDPDAVAQAAAAAGRRFAVQTGTTIAGGVGGAMLPAHSPMERAQHAGGLALLSSPAGLSFLSLMATNPIIQRMLRATPGAVHAVMESP